MRVPLSWMREFVEIPQDTRPEDILESLVRVGFEEEAVHRFELDGPIVVGEVKEFVAEPQKNGKTIRWCQVDVGDAHGGIRGIVCGAGNFFEGDKVVVTLPGSTLPGPFPIAARKTYGHVSDGMIASAKELGLGAEHDGILRLVELGLDAPVGSDAISLLGLDDVALDINVTPDRGYALSIRGIAREYSHATGAAFADPALRPSEDVLPGSGFPITINDLAPIRGRAGVTEFVARIVRDVDPTRPTPAWMITRLALAGIRNLGILIDITNYVMIELGQPIHGYDLDKVRGGLTVRRAEPGEKLETLDGHVRTLNIEDLLITDDSGPLGLAGVMGGGTTEMSPTTRNVLIEAAVFDPVSIARTARRHKLPSEASRRFERGVDPLVPFTAARRVTDLMVAYAGGTLDATQGGAIRGDWMPRTIELPNGFVSSLIGVHYTNEEVTSALELIGCTVESHERDSGIEGWVVTPPSWRPDLVDKATLTEEVARIHGLERIPSILPTPPSGRGLTPAQRGRRRVLNALAGAGFTEVQAFPFTTDEMNDLHGSPSGHHLPSIALANALDASTRHLRRSLVPGLLEMAHRNISRGLTDLTIFESGTVFLPSPGVTYGTTTVPPLGVRPDASTLTEIDAAIPPQPRYLAVLVTGTIRPKQPGSGAEEAGLVDVLDAVRSVGRAAGVTIDVAQTQRAALHPGRAGTLSVSGVEVGYVGEVLPAVAEAADLPARVAVAEIDLDRLLSLAGAPAVEPSLSSFPAATQDVSVLVAKDVPASQVRAALAEGAGGLVETIRLVDDYRGAGIGDELKSLTYALRFRASDRTLTAAEASEARERGVAVAAEKFGAVMRE